MAATRLGKLRIYMGYAAGVGKTYQALVEAQELKAKGADIVIGYFEPHGRKDTIAKTETLETIPRRKITYRDCIFEEMDTDAILARHPQICVVDEFPHTNVPGSPHAKRWEDVQVLLEAGIDVITTMNVQHLESLNDQVWHITGVRVRETVPDWVVQQADEVVMIDLTPRALLHRLARGVIYSQEKADQAMKNFFRESTLVALRELALRETAHEVVYRDDTAPRPGEAGREWRPHGHHKLLVLVTADPRSAMVIRRAKRIGDFLSAECFAVAVERPPDGNKQSSPERTAVEQHLNFARNLHIETRILEGEDAAAALVDFARRNQITQIFLGRPGHHRWSLPFFERDLVEKIVNTAKDMQVVIVGDRQPVKTETQLR